VIERDVLALRHIDAAERDAVMKASVLPKRYAIATAVALLAATPFAVTARALDMVISTNDGPRTAIVLPAGQSPRPTVIVLHGAAATAEIIVRESGFAEAAAAAGFTAVFPQGFYRRWHDLRSGGFDGPDDVAFLRALTTRLIEEKIALPTRIYIAGISNGGAMSFTMMQSGEPVARHRNRHCQYAGGDRAVQSATDGARHGQWHCRSIDALQWR